MTLSHLFGGGSTVGDTSTLAENIHNYYGLERSDMHMQHDLKNTKVDMKKTKSTLSALTLLAFLFFLNLLLTCLKDTVQSNSPEIIVMPQQRVTRGVLSGQLQNPAGSSVAEPQADPVADERVVPEKGTRRTADPDWTEVSQPRAPITEDEHPEVSAVEARGPDSVGRTVQQAHFEDAKKRPRNCCSRTTPVIRRTIREEHRVREGTSQEHNTVGSMTIENYETSLERPETFKEAYALLANRTNGTAVTSSNLRREHQQRPPTTRMKAKPLHSKTDKLQQPKADCNRTTELGSFNGGTEEGHSFSGRNTGALKDQQESREAIPSHTAKNKRIHDSNRDITISLEENKRLDSKMLDSKIQDQEYTVKDVSNWSGDSNYHGNVRQDGEIKKLDEYHRKTSVVYLGGKYKKTPGTRTGSPFEVLFSMLLRRQTYKRMVNILARVDSRGLQPGARKTWDLVTSLLQGFGQRVPSGKDWEESLQSLHVPGEGVVQFGDQLMMYAMPIVRDTSTRLGIARCKELIVCETSRLSWYFADEDVTDFFHDIFKWIYGMKDPELRTITKSSGDNSHCKDFIRRCKSETRNRSWLPMLANVLDFFIT